MLKPGVSVLQGGVSHEVYLREAAAVEVQKEEEHAQALGPGAMLNSPPGVRKGGSRGRGRGFCGSLSFVIFLRGDSIYGGGSGRMPPLEVGLHGRG